MLVFLGILCSMLLFHPSHSQVDPECSSAEGASICGSDTLGLWVSNITKGVALTNPVDSTTGRISYPITWDPDPDIPENDRAYNVVVREVNNSRRTPMILNRTRNFDQFIIRQLRTGVVYEAMVCYAEITVPQLPAIDQFLSQCGFCRTCFTAQLVATPTAPVFNRVESTVQEFPDDPDTLFVYHCEVTGVPPPTIRWRAINMMTGAEERITRDTAGVTIETSLPEDNEVSSTLTIFQESNFDMPICVAENSEGRAMLRSDEFLGSSSSTPTAGGVTVPVYAIVLLVVIPALITVTFIVIIIIITCVGKKRSSKTKLRDISYNGSVEANTIIAAPKSTAFTPVETSFVSQQHTRKASLISKLPNNLILSPEVLQVSTVIGQGEFGVVYKGYLKSEMMDTVAIKTLKGIFATASDVQNVSAEILKMYKFDHPNVMSLVGVCVGPSGNDSGASGLCIVMPFMAKGSLLDFLRKEAENLFAGSEEDSNAFVVRKTLLQMCLQIAKGMEYLSKLKFIHRDLAARNCLMDAHGVIKVSDFGLAEDIYSQNYFRQVEGGVKLPLKWMALESIKLGVFTEKTDVWSYGVTCWEIFNGGSIPYPGVHPHSVLEFIEEGSRLARPKNAACCENMYRLMLSFWERKDNGRPDFPTIVCTLSSYLESTSDYLDLTTMTKKEETIETAVIEDSPEHSIKRVPASANDYYVASAD